MHIHSRNHQLSPHSHETLPRLFDLPLASVRVSVKMCALLLALFAAGCAGNPTGPTPTPTQPPAATIPARPVNPAVPIFAVSGQSNACPLGNYLSLIGPTRFACSGGTPISAWSATPPSTFPTDWHWVWPDLAAVLTYAPPPDIFVWFQGESDATDELIPHYEPALADLLRRVRQATKPDLIIVVVGLEDFAGDRPRWEQIRAIQQRVVSADPRAVYVSTMDLPTCAASCQHLSEAGYSMLADRIVAAIHPLFFR